jgi:uncharacterized delta-60 repeat protein
MLAHGDRYQVANGAAAVLESLEVRRLFAAPVDLDFSFSGDGKVVTDFGGGNDVAHAVAVQSDGKIVVAGEAQVTVNGAKKVAFAAVRYNRDGSLDDGSAKDTTPGDKFGTGGKFTRVIEQGGLGGAAAIAIQKDGKIILAGTAVRSASTDALEFLRLNKDGTLDTSYGTNGIHAEPVLSSFLPKLNSIVLLPSGKLVGGASVEGDWLVVGLTSSGQLDKSFGSGTGFHGLGFGVPQDTPALAVDNLGRIVVSGNINANDGIGVARLRSDGTDDYFFGTNGQTQFKDPNASANSTDVGSLMVQPNGQIVVGYAILDGMQRPNGGVAVFDNTGKHISGGLNPNRATVTGLVNTPTDARFLGGVGLATGFADRFLIADISSEDENQVTFGAAGDDNIPSAMTIGPDGKIVQVGYTTAGGGLNNFAIARYVGTPTGSLGAISGNVFFDVDKDGVKESEDPNDFNQRVFLDTNNDGAWDPIHERSVLADNNGNYKFSVAPGTYHVREVVPPVEFNSLPLAPYVVNVAAKKTVGGINFGNATITLAQPRNQINGSVFFDFDGDGFRDVQNPTEPDLVGRTVFLDSNGNSKLDPGEPQTKTDVNGNFEFDQLAPGNYRVGDVLPAGWTHTDSANGFFDVFLATNQAVTSRFATTFADPDDTISEVNLASGNQVKVGGSVSFSITNVTDVDLVRFTAKRGQKIGFDVDRATGSSLNSLLRLFDANGNQLALNDDAAAPGESKGTDSYLTFTVPSAGNYFIGVSNNANKAYDARFGYGDNGVGTTGAYKLSLVNLSAAAVVAPPRLTTSSLFADRDFVNSLELSPPLS